MSETIERGVVGKLEFPLPEEESAFRLACDAGELWSVIWNLDQSLRGLIRHEGTSEEVRQFAEHLRSDHLAKTIEKHAE